MVDGVAVYLGGFVTPRKTHREVEVRKNRFEDVFDTFLTAEGETVYERASEEAGVGTEGECAEDVRTPTYTGVEGYRDVVAGVFEGIDNTWKGFERRHRAVDLASPMGRDTDAVGACLDGFDRIVGVQYAFDVDGKVGVFEDER